MKPTTRLVFGPGEKGFKHPVVYNAKQGNPLQQSTCRNTGIGSFVNWNAWSPKDQSSEKSWYAFAARASARAIILVKTLNARGSAKGRKFVFNLKQWIQEQSWTHKIKQNVSFTFIFYPKLIGNWFSKKN